MKHDQLDIFGTADSGASAPGKAKPKPKPKRKRSGPKKLREVKKAPMLVDAYDAGRGKPIPEKEVEVTANAEETPPAAEVDKGPHIYTVAEITERIKDILEGGYPDIWITGEVTDFKNKGGPHYYFGLKDDKKNKIKAIIFGASSRKIPFELKDGLEIICHGHLNVYGPSSGYSIVIDRMEPKGIGALQLAFEQLKKKLEAEGLFSAERKKPIPYLPRRIGIVTSPTGAAIRDIVHVLTRRFPNIEMLLHPARVQGEGAAPEIAAAIRALNERSDLDVLIVGRGGGSIEDLWPFNEEIVARAIADSRLPVISAVGHEIDFTISDFVADVRAPTPSAAAEIAVPVRADLLSSIEDRRRQLAYALKQGFERRWQELHKLAGRIRDPGRRFPDLLRSVDVLRQRLVFVVRAELEKRVQLIAKLASNMDHLSPLGVLAKGYSVAEDAKGRVVKSAKSLKIGDSLKLRFHEGVAQTRVTKRQL